MKRIPYEAIGEALYEEQLDNGLRVYVLAKQGFSKTYATFTTRYGSIDNHFRVEGQDESQVPDGIAHFLEHKMFEEPEGDVFATFSANGASANAFTSFDRTSYLFSSTSKINDNLTTLLNFVQHPYFTEQSVEKEKGIIGQEINMYQDHPDSRLYYGLIEALFQHHPVRIDIAGSLDSISRITPQTLLDCYHAFYHPSNMILFVVGGVDPTEIMQLVRDNQAGKSYEKQGDIQRYYAEKEPAQVMEEIRRTKLPVALPKCLLGFKEVNVQVSGKEAMKREAASRIVFDLLFSPSSEMYQSLYNDGIISDSFGSEYNLYPGFAYSAIGGDTKDPVLMVQRIRDHVERLLGTGLQEEDFERSKRKKIGGFLRMLNSPEAIANEFTKYRFRDMDWFDLLPTYEGLTLADVNERMKEHFNWDRMSVSIVSNEEAVG